MASSSSSALNAQYVAEIQEVTTSNMIGIVVPALLLYDVILTSGQEYRYIWQSSKSRFSRIIYVWNRYMYLLGAILGLAGIPPLSDPVMFTTLRIYALSKKNKILGGLALALSMAPFLLNTGIVYHNIPINLPAPVNCQIISTASTSLDIGILVTLNAVDMTFAILSIAVPPENQASYVVVFIDPISSILNGRFLLALHETNARLEGATDTSGVSSLCFNTRSGGDSRAGSSELPELLGVIGGSICSFHNDDEDLQCLEFAPPQEELQAEPEGEAVELQGGVSGGQLA
ncbi:uncharacterized protein TRAVEDRAFT_43423 [Trametes versicolor FP-101664 SS1]|uniref:uncharacterized protein n=1 Tax=Trametes versicolor (strain FP-101664) TaxID=717944 RepID=UPI00046236E5|nr:uncharacterized protein TRAVEDRAFT_43423 [Trametes versicolor FP-101664 SS1]EIW63117.1 hypothetical protein TRAVEDRAFT_43423 [Trametes versicolor FP-101664 SS1]